MTYRPSVLCVQYQTPPEDGAEGTELVKGSKMPWVRWINADNYSPTNPFRGKQRVLARLYMKRGDEEAYMGQGARGAGLYFEKVKPRLYKLADQGIYDVGGPNEPTPSLNTYADYEAFWCRLIALFASNGFVPWAWDFGNGWPGLARFNDAVTVARFKTSIALAQQARGGLVLHEYNAPCVINPNGNDENCRTLRVLHLLDELEMDVPTMIGECGITRAAIGGPDVGYRSYNQWVYPPMYGLPSGAMSDDLYWAMMSALDDEYRKIPNVVAAFPFVTNPESDWRTFDWHGGLIRRSVEKWAKPEPVPPAPPPSTDLAMVNAFIDRLPMTRKLALALGYEFLGEVQVDATRYVAVCFNRGRYVVVPVMLMGSTWVTGEVQPLDRPVVG